MSLSQNVDMVKVVFPTRSTVYLKNKTVDAYKMLLDSGALHANYVSEAFFTNMDLICIQ
jgi:hypothetical protein